MKSIICLVKIYPIVVTIFITIGLICCMLGVSRTRFYELRDMGIAKEPTCRAGSKEKMSSIKMLDEAKKKIS